MNNINELKIIARQVRINIIQMLSDAGSGHPAGSLGIADILTALYFNLLNHQPDNPLWPARDRFLLSAGHLCPALYATLVQAGYFPQEELSTLRALGSRLQGHTHRQMPPGVEISAGSLGQGLSVACGMALSAKLDKKDYHVISLTSDGEHDEGQTWEAVMLAAKYKLNNLVNIIDRNHIQIDGTTEEIMPFEPLAEKYKAFNWQVINIDGHNFEEIISAYKQAEQSENKPAVIIAKTIPGKSVSFMENNCEWHGKAPTKEEAKKAIGELKRSALARIARTDL